MKYFIALFAVVLCLGCGKSDESSSLESAKVENEVAQDRVRAVLQSEEYRNLVETQRQQILESQNKR